MSDHFQKMKYRKSSIKPPGELIYFEYAKGGLN